VVCCRHIQQGQPLASPPAPRLVNPEDIEDVRREIRVMHHLSGHPHVVSFKGAYEDASHVHIVMELCTGGEVGLAAPGGGALRNKAGAAAWAVCKRRRGCLSAALTAHCADGTLLLAAPPAKTPAV
jgi:hypothetical protein